MMKSFAHIEGLPECIGRAIQDHLAKSSIDWADWDSLSHPVLRVEAFLEDGNHDSAASPRSERIASRTMDLAGIVTPAHSRSPTTFPSEQHALSPVDERPHQVPPIERRDSQEIVGFQHQVAEEAQPHNVDEDADEPRRKGTGGLRISQTQSVYREDASEHQRRMQSDNRNFPKRRKVVSEKFVFQPSTLDKLITGIWEQIHGSLNLDPRAIFEQFQVAPAGGTETIQAQAGMEMETLSANANRNQDSFSRMNIFCRKVTQASRVCRSIEIIVQARWVELFEEQVQLRIATVPELSATKHRKATFMEACQDFAWSEKELRNKMAIWRGYKEVKDAAGWASLVFSGMGIYRFCKYRVGFDKDAMRRLQNLRKRLEVAADTLHPNWRQILSIVGESSKLQYTGHPHDWVVFEDGSSDPVPLRSTYLQHDPYFAFEHIDESLIDESAWGCDDPRWIPQSDALTRANGTFLCAACGEKQSDNPKSNACYCFPKLLGCVKRSPPPIQVYRTPDGRNNGLVALTSFERGAAVGEFVGLVTKGLRHLDVMDSSTPTSSYQIWQGRQGNYTRFVNHSCKANAQISQFTWLDTQRVILISKGIDAGAEITVDYGDKYWAGLDKVCRCGESCCRYRREKEPRCAG